MNFDFKSFNWKEATSNEHGQSSAALFVCFWFGVSLIILTLIVGFLLVVNSFYKLTIDFTPILLFIGTQIGIVMTYLFGRLSSNNKLKIETNDTNK